MDINNLLIFFLVFSLNGRISADLQGPPRPTDVPELVEQVTPEPQETSKEPAGTASPTESSIRKSAPFLADKIDKNALDTSMEEVSKALKAALFERVWNENLMRQKLTDQIKTIESRKEIVDPIDPTPEQIEAHTLYELAMGMLAKPRSNKDEAYKIMKKAADMKHAQARATMAWAAVLGHWKDFNFEYAASEFDELVLEGLPDANMGLAFLYSVGVGGKNVSQPKALIHLTLAALGGHTFAQMALGYRYSYGINVPMSCEKSLNYYKKVAKKVASKVTFSNGPIVHRVRLLDESENPGSHENDIVDYYQLLAEKGDVQSQVGLGQLYYQGGKAIQQDHQKALEYFTQAAKAGNAIGYAFLGKLYLEGNEYIKADNETALKYFKEAAELGDPVGQSGLGLMYLKGLGVEKNPMKALNYFTQAADQGWVDGQLQLGNMYFTGNGVKTDYKLALKYFNLASQSGHVLAYFNLGIMHAYGLGMLRSCPAAVEFFKNVAERGRWSSMLMDAYNNYKNYRINEAYMQYGLLSEIGYEVAQSNAGYLLDRSDVTIFHNRHEELIRAFYYWKRAAAQGYSNAQVKLGDYYYYGLGTEVDFETAAVLYRKASEQFYNAQAMFNLGYMHEQGLGMKKDWHLAKRLYDLAAETNADAKVPVAIALLKLQVLAKIEAIKESPYRFIFYLDENIAANWDLYMITILTLLLGFIMYTRRPYQQQQPQQQQQQQEQQQQQPQQQHNEQLQQQSTQVNTAVDSGAQSPHVRPNITTESDKSSLDNKSEEEPCSSKSVSNDNSVKKKLKATGKTTSISTAANISTADPTE
ncbi:protein sel-1 homolog 1 [Teleopsis dalmanni]|uniref:protein sel-1 homolog 1 n=1 Tax=Teleopsis dalmanni TaxID=139649 RepID=UPI0018CCB249|nr:protein sel-1 homolog 1 [Teleopsis dalmanni]XP_037948536.1 protein sel-1 homolog 1 [Teleopsis dalmanni]